MEPGVYTSRCIGKDKCGLCLDACNEEGALEFEEGEDNNRKPVSYTHLRSTGKKGRGEDFACPRLQESERISRDEGRFQAGNGSHPGLCQGAGGMRQILHILCGSLCQGSGEEQGA